MGKDSDKTAASKEKQEEQQNQFGVQQHWKP